MAQPPAASPSVPIEGQSRFGLCSIVSRRHFRSSSPHPLLTLASALDSHQRMPGTRYGLPRVGERAVLCRFDAWPWTAERRFPFACGAAGTPPRGAVGATIPAREGSSSGRWPPSAMAKPSPALRGPGFDALRSRETSEGRGLLRPHIGALRGLAMERPPDGTVPNAGGCGDRTETMPLTVKVADGFDGQAAHGASAACG